MNVDELYQAIQELPEEVRSQAEDFVFFLRDRHKPALSEEKFWGLIDLIEDPQGDMDALVTELAEEKQEVIFAFQDILAEKLSQLDTPNFWEQGGGSADGFLYVRCYVVAQGKAFFKRIINEEEKFPAEPWLVAEQLLYVPAKAFEKGYGEELKRLPATNYESRTNLAAWKANSAAA